MQGECDVVLDLVNSLLGGKHMLFKLLPGKPKCGGRWRTVLVVRAVADAGCTAPNTA